MDDGKGVYGVLKKLYESDSKALERKNMGVKSLCDEERYSHRETKLGSAGKKQKVYSIIHRLNALNVSVLVEEAGKEHVGVDELEAIIADLKSRGLIYEPEPGVLGCAGD